MLGTIVGLIIIGLIAGFIARAIVPGRQSMTILQTIVNHVDFGMPLAAALAARRVSQTDSPTSLAEPAFMNSGLRRTLSSQFGEKFSLATGSVRPFCR